MTAQPAGRRIAHVDMDAFYASVELLRRPELRDRPVAIGGSGNPDSRGVVTTATYAARAYGVRSGMPMRHAVRLCRDIVFLPVDFAAYRHYSRRFKAALSSIVPITEDRGIDESYADLSELDGDSQTLGRAIKKAIQDATGLTASVGIAPNKLLAKISSDLNKPDGLTVLGADDLVDRIWPLPPGKINGIGPKAQERLAALGITSIGMLAAARPALLQKHFGAGYAQWLLDAAHGRDDRPVVTDSEPRSRSRETTFEADLHPVHDADRLRMLVTRFAGQVADDIARSGHGTRTIGIKLRFDDWSQVTRDHSLSKATTRADVIEQAALVCLGRVELKRRIRLFGLRASGLLPSDDLPDDSRTPQLF